MIGLGSDNNQLLTRLHLHHLRDGGILADEEIHVRRPDLEAVSRHLSYPVITINKGPKNDDIGEVTKTEKN